MVVSGDAAALVARPIGKMMNERSLAARVEAELRTQGLTRAICDPDMLRQVVGLLGMQDVRATERRLAEARQELARLEVRIRLDQDLP
jgi:hypothetical protein